MTLETAQSAPYQRPLQVGNVTYRNGVILAPMSGVSDVPFRRAAWNAGAGMVISEMVASEALVTGQAEMQMKAEGAGLPVHVVQLAGRQAKWMAHAAELAEANGAHVVDINMGCPARRVTTGMSGSALMRDLDHALGLIEATVAAVKIPVTLKMRLGWDHDTINAPDLARRAADAGVQLITVHGRTRCQFYKGAADWEAVQAVRDVIDLPLIINGDIKSSSDGLAAMRACGADGIMIGRASYGAPDLPGRIADSTDSDKQSAPYDMVAHYLDIIDFYGDELGVRCARKHIGWWMEGLSLEVPKPFKAALMTSKDPQFVIDSLQQIQREIAAENTKDARHAA